MNKAVRRSTGPSIHRLKLYGATLFYRLVSLSYIQGRAINMAQTTIEPEVSSSSAKTIPTKGFATHSATSPLGPFSFERRQPGRTRRADRDPVLRRLSLRPAYRAQRMDRTRRTPVVPGHEIVGRVTKVGAKVTKFKEGDLAGVGCMVDSCRTAAPARKAWSSIAKSA